MNKRLKWLRVVFVSILLCPPISIDAQTIIKGYVRDSASQAPLSFVSIYFQGGKGVTSNDDGSFAIETNNSKYNTIIISYTGYKKLIKKIVPGVEQVLDIGMELDNALGNVVIKAKRGKYRNKDNPAVELIDKVIANKSKNRITAYDFTQFQQYEKLELSLTKKPEKLANSRLFKNYKFILENADTTTLEGKALIPVYLEEKLSQNYYRKSPLKNKSYILAEKKVNYSDLLDNNGITAYLKRLYAEINIYNNDVTILTTQFLSPIADLAPQFYRFFITDTVEEDGIKLVKLNFMPRNTADLLFKGIMYVTLDGNYGVQKITLSISKKANLNWARELRIAQDFEKSAVDGRYHVIKSTMKAEFVLRQNSPGGVLGERTVSFKNFAANTPAADSIYEGKDEVAIKPGSNSDSILMVKRHQQLTTVEANVYANIDSLQNMKSFKTTVKIATLILSGYIKFGAFELGNTNTFYSFNSLEGFRAKVAGRTTPVFSKHVYMEGYGGYGFKDKQYKYLFAAAYSFNGKSIYTYPLNYIKFTRQYETSTPGQELVFAAEDNFILSFKRGTNNKWLYNDSYKLEYIREFGKNFMYKFRYKYLDQFAAASLVFEKNIGGGGSVVVPDIITSEISAEIRWAPHEQFYQGINTRIPIKNKFPVFTLRIQDGIKGLFKGQYNYQQLTLAIAKRCFLSQLGYADVTLEGGHIFGQVPYPLLDIHRANQSYSYQLNAYNLMNFMEFVSDNYLAMNGDFYFNGFFLNKLPLIKKLKLREAAGFKILYGGIRNENNPDKTTGLFNFPTTNVDGVPVQTTYALNKTPYIEASIGIANIFKLIRLDLIKRFTYRNHPEISTLGLRARVKFDF